MSMAIDPDRAYWESRLAAGPSLDTVGWLGLGRSFNRAMYRVRAITFKHRIVRALRAAKIQPSNATVLDVGSGSGFYIDLWQQIGVRDLRGSDLTEAVVSKLSAAFPNVNFVRADIGAPDVPLPNESFDVISCMDVLFHIMDDKKYENALENIASLLRPGGLFVFSENCIHGPRISGPHQVSRSLGETMRGLDRARLDLIQRKPAFVLMNTPVDSDNRFLRALWALSKRIATSNETAAGIVAAVLTAPEIALTALLREGPSTEMLICRKRAQTTTRSSLTAD